MFEWGFHLYLRSGIGSCKVFTWEALIMLTITFRNHGITLEESQLHEMVLSVCSPFNLLWGLYVWFEHVLWCVAHGHVQVNLLLTNPKKHVSKTIKFQTTNNDLGFYKSPNSSTDFKIQTLCCSNGINWAHKALYLQCGLPCEEVWFLFSFIFWPSFQQGLGVY